MTCETLPQLRDGGLRTHVQERKRRLDIEQRMGITGEIVFFVVGLTVLALLLTGPGMWSEKWGWRFFDKDGWKWLKKRKKP